MATVQEVIACAETFADRVCLREEARHELLVQAFLNLAGATNKSLPAGGFVGNAVKALWKRLRYHGPRSPHETFDQLRWVQGAGMDSVSEKRPGPFRVIAALDTLRQLKRRLTAQELHLVECVQSGATKDHAIACLMGIRETMVRAIRKSILLRYKKMLEV